MSASQIELAARSQEDQWFTENPNRTFFEAKYKPKVNRLRETYEIPFDNQGTTFGTTGICTIPVKGDYMTSLTLRAVLPPIYPTVPGQYVFPTPSSQVGGTVYVNKTLTQVVADGTTLTANTSGNHYFSVGAQVTLSGTAYVIFDLDGTYTVSSIPTANSFTCSTVISGISYNGTVSSPGIQCGDVVSYFSTTNSNLWVNNVTNKTWSITNAAFNGPQTQLTVTTSTSSNFLIGQNVNVIITSLAINGVYTVISSTDTTFTISLTPFPKRFVAVRSSSSIYSTNNGQTWSSVALPAGTWLAVAWGNGVFVAVKQDEIVYSTSTTGLSWTTVSVTGTLRGVAYGNGTFVAVGDNTTMYSTDNGQTWTTVAVTGTLYAVTYGNGAFVAIGTNTSMYSTNNGQSWTTVAVTGTLRGVAYGSSTFVAVGTNTTMYSTNNGQSWTTVAVTGTLKGVAYGSSTFVAVGTNTSMYSTNNGQSWTTVAVTGTLNAVAYGNSTFVAGGTTTSMYSTNNGQSWTTVAVTGTLNGIAYGEYTYASDVNDLTYMTPPPITVSQTPSHFTFSSNIYPSISFANAADAAFWGFDSRQGLTYTLPVTSPWTFTQSGWISGFLPPSTSTYDDSVAHKLCKSVRILVGKQTIKEYSGEYIELHNDLLVPYENKAILKLMNGTLDQTQATVSREYYVSLPLGTKEVPLCALTHQQMSVEIDFDLYQNLSQNLNQGTGNFLDAKSYTTYNASTGILNGQPVNVQTTFSYQQYIFIVTYGGQFIIFDTTKNVDDPTSYIVLSAFSGTNLFSQFCVLSGNLYIGLSDGTLARMIISELIQGNISSFVLNNYNPTIGSLVGTIVADFRYVYYAVSNTATSNVFVTKYDTTGSFTSTGSYTSFNFTQDIDSSATTVYQLLSSGTQLLAITNTNGKLYNFNLNGNFITSWSLIDYSSVAYQITSGVLIGGSFYFIADSYKLLVYDGAFTSYILYPQYVAVGTNSSMVSTNGQAWNSSVLTGSWYGITFGNGTFVAVGLNTTAYSIDGQTWTPVAFTGSLIGVTYGNGTFVAVGTNTTAYSTNGQNWTTVVVSGNMNGIAYGNGTFIAVGTNTTMYSTNNGQSWTTVAAAGDWYSVAFGNGVFVAVGQDTTMYSTDNGQSWTTVAKLGSWNSVAFGNGVFVAAASGNEIMYSTNNGQTWSIVTVTGDWFSVTFGNGTFVAVGPNITTYSTDGQHWTYGQSQVGAWDSVTFANSSSILSYVGTNIQNLIAVGSKIYASSNSASITSVVQIDTTKNLSSPGAYNYYSSTTPNAPQIFDQNFLKIFANGPRYVYMFTQGDTNATNVYRFDPYTPDATLQASILVDYETLPDNVKKPDKALIGLVQTQKVTDMNQMNIKNPVKELWITGVPDSANVFQYANLSNRATLTVASEQIITNDVGTRIFLNTTGPFETHTAMPIRNFSVVPFEVDPESNVPNGTVNFSRIRDQILSARAATVWARNYNILAIQGGIGGLIFDS